MKSLVRVNDDHLQFPFDFVAEVYNHQVLSHNALSSPNCVMRPKNCCKGNYLLADCGVPFLHFGS